MKPQESNELNKLRIENARLHSEVGDLKNKLSESRKVDKQKPATSKYPADMSSLLFENLFDKDPDGVFLIDNKGYILKANPAFCEQLASHAREVTGTHIREFLVQPEIFDNAFSEIQKTGYIEQVVKQKTSGRNILTVEWKAGKISPPNKSNFLILVISRDITERITKEREEHETRKQLHGLNHELYTLNQLHEATAVELEESYEALEVAYSKLKHSEENYRLISENTGDYIFRISILNKKPVISYAGPAVKKLGYKPEEIEGNNPINFLHESDKEKTRRIVSKYYAEYLTSGKLSFEKDIYIPIRVTGHFNELIHLECTINISRREIIVVAKDITDLLHEMELNKRRKKRLERIEKSYRNLYNSASDIFLIIDKDLKILDANPAASSIFGYSRKELRNIELHKILPFDDLHIDKSKPPYLQLKQSTEDFGLYLQAKTKTGEKIWMSAVFEKTAFNESPATFAVLRNINELKKAQDLLRESEQKFRMLAESGGSGILIYSGQKLLYANKTIEEIVGYTEDELKSISLRDLVHPDMQHLEKDPGDGLPAGEKVDTDHEIKLSTKSGAVKWINFSAKNIDYKGQIATIGNVVDITDYKTAMQKLKIAKDKAVESDRLKSAFLSNMSHEIRTPMNGIIGFSQLLDDDNLDAESRKHYVEIIKGSSKQLLRIIDDILDVSKIEVGQMSVKKEWHVADLILSDLYDVFEKRVADFGTDVKLVYAGTQSGEKIYTDSVRLKQILSNLIDNALKYTAKGSITFGYRKRNDDLVFFVKDTGCGIETDLQKYIFTRFGRLEKNYLKSVRGTGLGLAISKGLTDLLGGEIYFESDGKTGTDFYISHPINPV